MEPVKSNQSDTKTRISVLENNMSILTTNVDKLESKIDNNYAVLHSRISDLRDDLRTDFESKQEKVIRKIEEHSESSNHHNQQLNKRIDGIEKWRFMLMGGALVLGYFLAHVKLDSLF
jgi:predicted RNase H-like nuclease (RuvC/YqgF family)